MKIVDSCGWIEYLADGPLADEYASHLEQSDLLITPSIVAYEVYKRILRDTDRDSALVAAALISRTHVIALDAELAMAAAELSLRYRLPMADAIVYATGQALSSVVVTSDAHFAGLPGVEFVEKP